ncbi:MAG TPA: hypothetical protein VMV94_06535 [Phycisphaerae bacterium]|nr:hypothetical protein [Phycisphaerae bacterium]
MLRLTSFVIGFALFWPCPLNGQISRLNQEKHPFGRAGVPAAQPAASGFTTQPMAQAPETLSTGVAETTPLSAQQQAQLAVTFQQLDADLQNLLAAAETQIAALLTPEQQAQLAAHKLQGGHAAQQTSTAPPSAMPGPQTVPPQSPAGMAGTSAMAQDSDGEHHRLDAFEQLSDLTDAQLAAIHSVKSILRLATKSLCDKAAADFRAILTPAQAAIIDQQPGQPRAPSTAQPGESNLVAGGTAGDPVQLTQEQQTQAAAIFAQLDADTQLLRLAAMQQILSLLTDAQKSQLPAATATDNPPSGAAPAGGVQPPPGGPGTDSGGAPSTAAVAPASGQPEQVQAGEDHESPLAELTAQLNLSASQSDTMASILNNLQTMIQTRVQQSVTDLRAVVPAPSSAAGVSPATPAARTTGLH